MKNRQKKKVTRDKWKKTNAKKDKREMRDKAESAVKKREDQARD